MSCPPYLSKRRGVSVVALDVLLLEPVSGDSNGYPRRRGLAAHLQPYPSGEVLTKIKNVGTGLGLGENDLEDMPRADTAPHAAGDGFLFATAGHVHVEHGLTARIGEQRADADHFMRVLKRTLHRYDRLRAALRRSHNESTAVIGAAYGDERGGRNAMGFLNEDPRTSNINAFTEAVAADSDKALEMVMRRL